MPNIQNITNCIDRMTSALTELKRELSNYMSEMSVQSTQPAQSTPEQAQQSADDFTSFEALRKALESNKWPEAVNPNLICHPDNEQDKIERGRGIVELMIEEDLKGLKVLDFGCGEGQCCYAATDYNPSKVVGYDIEKYDTWEKYTDDSLLYTDDFDKVIENGPYDVVVLFDVIDHVKKETPVAILEKIKSVLSDDGKIYVRCHPFISRHGTHLYHELNKAYAHLVFTPNELKTILPNPKWQEDSIGVIFPIKTYSSFFSDAGLEIINRRDVTEKVDSFFKIPKIAERIMQTTNTATFPEFQMSIQFIDMTVKKPKADV